VVEHLDRRAVLAHGADPEPDEVHLLLGRGEAGGVSSREEDEEPPPRFAREFTVAHDDFGSCARHKFIGPQLTLAVFRSCKHLQRCRRHVVQG